MAGSEEATLKRTQTILAALEAALEARVTVLLQLATFSQPQPQVALGEQTTLQHQLTRLTDLIEALLAELQTLMALEGNPLV